MVLRRKFSREPSYHLLENIRPLLVRWKLVVFIFRPARAGRDFCEARTNRDFSKPGSVKQTTATVCGRHEMHNGHRLPPNGASQLGAAFRDGTFADVEQ